MKPRAGVYNTVWLSGGVFIAHQSRAVQMSNGEAGTSDSNPYPPTVSDSELVIRINPNKWPSWEFDPLTFGFKGKHLHH